MAARADYGNTAPEERVGGTIAAVDPGGPAERAGLGAGDTILAANGERVRDVIDWQWIADADRVVVRVAADGGMVSAYELVRAPGEAWGLSFADAVFDGVRTCRNRCAFCFMAQLPRGMRRALYVRDDDFRLSFLQGNFVTLTNLSDEDIARIAEQRLSPLYVSLHAVQPDVRATLVCASEDRALERFDELLSLGIDLHVQIVLVPGVNDGDILDASLSWLAERDGVLSVGLVPLGYTAHQQRFSASYETPAAARSVIAQIEPWQSAFRERDGVTWVYLADEFYLNGNAPIPPAEHYDGFQQYENGIGLVRAWLDEADTLRDTMASANETLAAGPPIVLITGTLFAPVLQETIAALGLTASAEIRVLAVPNGFFGGNVSVAGLLVGADLVDAIASVAPEAIVLVPDVVANADGLLLDDMPALELAHRSGRDVRLVSCDAGGLLGGLLNAAAGPSHPKE